jgi:hypothetical protein
MTKDEWIWMPHAAHFCASDDCRFHLATYVGGYIVSTVGEYVPKGSVSQPKGKQFMEVGPHRLYEAMVFVAEPSTNKCCPWAVRTFASLQTEGSNSAPHAYQTHLRLCKEWALVEDKVEVWRTNE